MKNIAVLLIASSSVFASAQGLVPYGIGTALKSAFGTWETVQLAGSSLEVTVPSGPKSTFLFYGVSMLVGKSEAGLQYMVIGAPLATASTEPNGSVRSLEITGLKTVDRMTHQSFAVRGLDKTLLGQLEFDPKNPQQALQAKAFLQSIGR